MGATRCGLQYTYTRAPICYKKGVPKLSYLEEETFLNIKQKYNESLRKVTVQGGVIDVGDKLETLLDALPKKYDIRSGFISFSLISHRLQRLR